MLKDWADELGIAYLGTIKELQVYHRCIEQGLSVFDPPQAKLAPYLQDWVPITTWLNNILSFPTPLPDPRGSVKPVARVATYANIARGTSGARPSDDVAARPLVAPPSAEGIPTFLRKLITRVF